MKILKLFYKNLFKKSINWIMKFYLKGFIEWVNGRSIVFILEILLLNLFILRIENLFVYVFFRSFINLMFG